MEQHVIRPGELDAIVDAARAAVVSMPDMTNVEKGAYFSARGMSDRGNAASCQ